MDETRVAKVLLIYFLKYFLILFHVGVEENV